MRKEEGAVNKGGCEEIAKQSSTGAQSVEEGGVAKESCHIFDEEGRWEKKGEEGEEEEG